VNECRRMDPRSGCEVSRVVPTRWQIVLKGLCSGQSSTSIATIAFDSRSVLRTAPSSLWDVESQCMLGLWCVQLTPPPSDPLRR
jgi:hypothetical protein